MSIFDETIAEATLRFGTAVDAMSHDPRDDIDHASLVRRFPQLGEVTTHDVTINGPHGPIYGRVYRGPGESRAGLVWVHGGAFVAGGLDQAESHWVSLELASRGLRVLALDYQKAGPGVRHPVLSDEVLAGWSAAPKLLDLGEHQLFMGGASAGANLSAGVAHRLSESDAPMPRGLVLVYPVLHDVLPKASPEAAAAALGLPDYIRFTPAFMHVVNLNYVGTPEKLSDPVAFAAHGDVSGFPSTLIINAESDDLRSSGEAFARQLSDAGVANAVVFEPGTVHGYLDQPGLPAALATLARIADWVATR
jgi:acetyl esterase/lipase